jgi:CheY-like chemotaxis protein
MSYEINCADLQNRCLGQGWCYPNKVSEAKSLAYVVDDEEVIATTLAKILNQSGFEAVAFTRPLEALRAAEVRCPDFLITDVSMPILNGI